MAQTTPTTTPLPPDYEAARRSWERRTPWYRRTSVRLGIQSKLVICFMTLLSVGLASSCWLYVVQSNSRISDMMGEQARQMAYALALASRPALASGQPQELRDIGKDLLKARNVLFVGFLNSEAKPLALTSRDPDARWEDAWLTEPDTRSLMQVRACDSAVFGQYLEVTAPVVATTAAAAAMEGTEPRSGASRLLGYVSVGISQYREQAQLQRINYLVIGIGCVIAMMSLPLAYLLVHRIFQPIRQLVEATNQIAGGDLGAQVAIHRPDQIGTLARAFNEMVKRVKRQQDDLAAANAQLEAANHDLEQKVLARTAELEAANTRLSREIAEKEDFLRAVSHDLNAPLRNISGMATMLLMKYRQKFDEDVVHRLERIRKNVEVETALIGELLELSRIKTRRQKMEPVETEALVRELAGLFESDLKGRQIELMLDTPLPVLYCESARLRQVFLNLIDNAIKYMGQGSAAAEGDGSAVPPPPQKQIRVGCALRSDAAEFYVRDTGMGIDPQDIEKIFYVFRRGRNGAAQNVAGKGVGLASVKSIIETYNGSIWVQSELGRGSVFRFTIAGQFVPALQKQQAQEQGRQQADQTPTPTASGSGDACSDVDGK